MNCPACLRLLRRFKAGTVTLDGCDGGCGGIWFDHLELAKVTRKHSKATATVADIRPDPKVRVHDDDVRACPHCDGVTLKMKLYSLGSGVIMDTCPKCQGVWLDHGELDKIRDALHPQLLTHRQVGRKPVSHSTAINLDVVQQVQNLFFVSRA